jgi:hypothetical protein
MALADFYGLVDDLVRDSDQVISPTARDRALDAAVQRFSIDRPRELVEDVTSAGGVFLPLPGGWQIGVSKLLLLEVDPSSNVLNTIPGAQCAIYNHPVDPARIRLPDGSAQVAGAIIRCRYTATHALTEVLDTIPANARHAVSAYAASVCCGELASHYAADSDATIQADSVDHRTKSQTWAARASALRTEYSKLIGIDSAPQLAPMSGAVKFTQRTRFPRQRQGLL